MLYFPMDFGELTLDRLIDTGGPLQCNTEADLWKIRLLEPQSIVKGGPAPIFSNNGRKWRPRDPEKYRGTEI